MQKDGLIYTMNYEDIKLKLEEYLTVNEDEKEENGEVFTPPNLIEEMLDKLPPSIWKNPDAKWLDPACGIGNYMILVYYRLMESLKSWESNSKKRSDHIIKNMLYMTELNKKNINIATQFFGKNANLCQCDFLNETERNYCMKNFGATTFDIILGNPPYNSGGIRARTSDKIKHIKTDDNELKTLWPEFVTTSISLLKDETSRILFIHPASWISFKGTNGEVFKTKQIEYIKYYDYKNSNTLFGKESGKIPLAYYLLKNTETKNNTIIFDNSTSREEEFNIYENDFIPTESINMWKKILKITKKYGNLEKNFVHAKPIGTLTPTKTKTNVYPVVSVINREIKIEYTDKNNNPTPDKKLVFTNTSMGYPILDTVGNVMLEHRDRYWILADGIEKKLKQLQNYFYTDMIFYLITITKTRQNFIDNKIFSVIPDITKATKKINITDDYLIKLFGLSREDLIGYRNYLENGEGRLDEELKKKLKSFKINQKIKIKNKTQKLKNLKNKTEKIKTKL